jgi:magnesium chelatase accessory protein
VSRGLIWEKDGRDWPNRTASRFVDAWRALAPILSASFKVVAPDLPGHGFTATPSAHRLSLPGMAAQVSGLLRALDLKPSVVAGHSAGAAILVRMCLDERVMPRILIGLNGALLPPTGFASDLFSPLAKLLARIPAVPNLFASWVGEPTAVERLIRSTGSTIDADGVALYRRLVRNPSHVAGALGMMAQWDLRTLRTELPRLKTRLALVVGSNDRTIAPADAALVRSLVPGARITTLPGLGHLAHEERPDQCARVITELAA